MDEFAYSVMKECYKWRMFMTFMALMMNLIHMLSFRQYTLNSWIQATLLLGVMTQKSTSGNLASVMSGLIWD